MKNEYKIEDLSYVITRCNRELGRNDSIVLEVVDDYGSPFYELGIKDENGKYIAKDYNNSLHSLIKFVITDYVDKIKQDIELLVNRSVKTNELKSYIENFKGVDNIIFDIKDLDSAIEWVKNGYDIVDYHLLEENGVDIDTAFELMKISSILWDAS